MYKIASKFDTIALLGCTEVSETVDNRAYQHTTVGIVGVL
jgi:hypothetical protein